MATSSSEKKNGAQSPNPGRSGESARGETVQGFGKLRDLIDQHFSLDEIQALCFDLRVEFEHLAGNTRPLKIQNLIAFLAQRKRLPDLVSRLQEQRPQVDWMVADQEDWTQELPEEPVESMTTLAYERPGRMAQYLDFEVEVGLGLGREYPVTIIRSPAGEARETMHFPYDELALENRLQSLQIALLHAGGTHRQMLSPEEQLVQEFGRDLFNALLSGEARSRFDVSCSEARQQGKGLRMKLRILPPELARLPWEFLYDPRRAEYVCLSRDTPVIRYLELPQPIQPLTVAPPLRILGMTVSPTELPPLDIAREKQRVDTAVRPLQAAGLVQLTWLTGSTWRDLQRAMRAGPWHIFHFIGHGGFDKQADEGFIALANAGGSAQRLLATELGRLLADHHSLRLVLLNSCEGARGSEHDIFSSTAAILVRRGLPAVLAMQYAITDRAAIEFARAFYEALTDNMPVDAAVAEARKAVSLAMTYTVEWGTPVLYMRAPQGIIFRLSDAPKVKLPDTVETDTELEQRLEQLYTDGLGAYWVEDWEKASRSFQSIIEVRPSYADTAVRLAEAQRQQKLQGLYDKALAASEDWPAMIATLEELVADMPDYRDAQTLLVQARQQKQLADLYAEAKRLSAAEQWQAVVNVFGQIRELEPGYPDPDELLAAAEKEVAELQRQAELNRLYGRAVREIDAGHWNKARVLLATITEMEPDFRETTGLLARAEEAAARAEAEQQRQAQISSWYEQALSLARAGQWLQVLAKIQDIKALDASFADPEGLAHQAITEIDRSEAEAQKQTELAAIYAEAVRLLKTQEYQAALEKWREVQALDAHYPDRQKVQRTAKKKLKQLSQAAAPKRRWPRKYWLWLGGVGVVVTAVALLLILNPFDWGDDKTGSVVSAPTSVNATTAPAVAAAELGECPEITAWQAEYWDNIELQGEPVLCLNESAIIHDWGDKSPGSIVPSDYFAARFFRPIDTPEGFTRFTLGSDDGARLWVDGVLYIDGWHEQGYNEVSVDVKLSEGDHTVQIEYYDAEGAARVEFSWETVVVEAAAAPGECPGITAWQAEYWDNMELQGDPVLCRNEFALSHEWGEGSPALTVPADYFSARFMRTFHFAESRQRFSLVSDDGARLWVDDVLVIDHWEGASPDHPPTFVDIDLNEGDHELRLEYFEINYGAVLQLDWTAVSDCAPGVIYCEDFENGRADNWELDNWEVVESGSNHVLQGTSEAHALLKHAGWTDYRLRLRLRIIKGGVHLGFRFIKDKLGNYHIGFSENWQYLHGQVPSGQFTDLQDINSSYALNRWRDIEVVGEGGHIQVYVDGTLTLDYVDNDPILEGGIWFETWDDSLAQIDDIEVLLIK